MAIKATKNKLMCKIDIPGITKEQADDIEARIDEFERDHEQSAVNGGPGWVKKMSPQVAAWAIGPTALAALWLILAYIIY